MDSKRLTVVEFVQHALGQLNNFQERIERNHVDFDRQYPGHTVDHLMTETDWFTAFVSSYLKHRNDGESDGIPDSI